MSQRRYYVALIGMILIMMSGATLLLVDKSRMSARNPDDVVWMERIRRNALDTLIPVRERIEIVSGEPLAIRVSGIEGLPGDTPARVIVEEGDPDLALDVILAARDDIIATSEWRDVPTHSTLPAPRNAKRLYKVKDNLWFVTLEYIDTLSLIYAREVEVPSSRVAFLEGQLDTYKGLLEEEIARLGLDPVE